MVVGAMVVGAMVVGAMVVGAMVVGAMVVAGIDGKVDKKVVESDTELFEAESDEAEFFT